MTSFQICHYNLSLVTHFVPFHILPIQAPFVPLSLSLVAFVWSQCYLLYKVSLAMQSGISVLPGLVAVTRTERRLCSHTVAPCHTMYHVHKWQRQSSFGFFRTNSRLIHGRVILSRLYRSMFTSHMCLCLKCGPSLFQVSAPINISPCNYLRWWVWLHPVTIRRDPFHSFVDLEAFLRHPPFPFAGRGAERK